MEVEERFVKKIKAKIKGTFTGVAYVWVDDSGMITEVEEVEVEDIENADDCEVIYQIGG